MQILTFYSKQYQVSELVDDAKNYYDILANKLSKPLSSSKTYWSILKTICNNRKTPLIPPMFIGNKLKNDFKLKSKHFNKFLLLNAHPLMMITTCHVPLSFTRI